MYQYTATLPKFMHTLGVFILRHTMKLLGSDRVSRRFIVVMSAAHLWMYRRSGGRFGGRLGLRGAEIVLLTTRGRKTGQLRTVPLLALRQGEDFVVIASYGGLGQVPAWWHNLSADAAAFVVSRRVTVPVIAKACEEPAKQEELWGRFVDAFAGYEDYRGRTSRDFPIVVLSPSAADADVGAARA